MTSVLYSGGLNYQSGNPVRQEILAVRREATDLRKQVELLVEENTVYRKYIIKLLKKAEDEQTVNEMTRELMSINSPQQAQQQSGQNTVEGGGFRR